MVFLLERLVIKLFRHHAFYTLHIIDEYVFQTKIVIFTKFKNDNRYDYKDKKKFHMTATLK